jgi:acyl transferase domain-containing protein
MSFVFGLKGPSLAVDTACSSSIVSAHMSHTAIASGAIGAAAACGVQFTAAFRASSLFNIAGMLAPDGRCKTLDAAANGAAPRGTTCCRVILLLLRVGDVSINDV